MQHKIVVKRPGKPAEITTIEGTYRCDLNKLLGEKITASYCHLCQRDAVLRLCLVCDEDGGYKNLPDNFDLITYGSMGSYHNRLKGTVIFFKYIYEPYRGQDIYDYKLFSVDDQDLALIEYLLSDQYQSQAKEFGKNV